ncbi:thiamine biosynthesis protein [Adhaeribacter soli]|uniref:Molybdopterin-synthase adenylyltransferase n=2 Tax=Adhaeribacter soli TaxID=2607655 RepID=A0A5N1J5P1_9BACT|nr:thiamine biosynthesis protein [Adhaeribacter soli]
MQSENLRYSCQIALPGFSETAQAKLREAKVLVVGAGGLGCPAAQYLAAAGIGTLGLADFDTISESNLHRQILFTPAEVGQLKAKVAVSKLQSQNPGINLIAHHLQVNAENISDLFQPYDLVVDCTDNFETRYLLNDACVLTGKPLVYGAIYQYEGQVAVWNILNEDGTRTPNYRDLFLAVDATQVPNCSVGGVIPTIAGTIGTMMANEVLKYFSGVGELLSGQVLLFDAFSMQSRRIRIGNQTKVEIKELPKIEKIRTISASEVRAALAEAKYELVDVRSAEERLQFNIGGCHIPLTELGESRIQFFEKGKPVVFYCATGKRSKNAAKLMEEAFPNGNYYSLAGGLQAWQEYPE